MIAVNVGGGNNGDEMEAAGGLDKIEGGDENRPPTQDGQGVEVQGVNDRRSSLESSPCPMVSRPPIDLEVSRVSIALHRE